MPDENETVQSVSGISISARTPLFWRDRPSLWFAQLEAILAPNKLSDEAKSQFVISHLERQDLEQISDLLLRPPANDKFKALKNRLIDVYEESEERRLQRLMEGLDLGDLTPSQLLRRIRDMSGASGTPPAVLQVLWMNKLPAHVRAILSASSGDLDTLAKVADKVISHCQPTASISALNTVSRHRSSSPDLATTLREINQRLAALEAVSSPPRQPRYPYRRSRPGNWNRSASRRRATSRQGSYCFYHRRFGTEARKCEPPCNFRQENAERHPE